MKYLLIAAVLAMTVLSGCWQIWNAGDLAEWVREQAIEEGCDPATIELNEWYDATEEGNVWSGMCMNATSGESMTFGINVDAVWTPSEAPVAEEASPELTVEELRSASYSSELYEEAFTLTDGQYEDEQALLTIDYDAALFGDLDGDGVDDAVVFLEERGGGTATNLIAAAQRNEGGQPVDVGSVLVDSNIQIISAAIENETLRLEVTTRGPGDANCCASYRTERTFALQDGVLAEAGEPTEPIRVSADDLNGTSWTLAELAEGQPAQEEPPITIAFEDGSLTGSAGCNAYSADFTLSQDNPFIITIGPIVTTRMSCPAPIMEQEAAYLAALEKVSLWGYDTGKLAISFVEEGELHERLLFMATDAVEVD